MKDVQVTQPVTVSLQDIATTSNKVTASESLIKEEKSELIYKNKQLAFSFTFPESWSGYRYKEATSTVSFGIKDQDMIFAIIAIPKSEWKIMEDDYNKNGTPIAEKIAENETYVFAYDLSQDATSLAAPYRGQVSQILKSFKIK